MVKRKHSNLIAEMPAPTRPRERLEHLGASVLSDQELLAIILRTGGKDQNVMHLALHVFSHFESLYELKQSSLEEIQKIKGIGLVKAIEIQASLELGLRMANSQQLKSGQIKSTVEIGTKMVAEMKDLNQEHLLAIYLNTKNQIIKKQTIFVGGLNQSIAHPREIFKGAVKYSAAKVIMAHNHPSGNPEPSANDRLFTQRMVNCGELMGIELLDHLIIGGGRFISMREQGAI